MAQLQRIHGRVNEIGPGMQVRRVLPAAAKRSVGPFIFFDHMGPVTLGAELNSDVDGHPHIGLATVTYLFEGSLLHRDSVGSEQLITPGAVNWMTAGRGVVHSERTPPAEQGQSRRLHGLQLWVALPPDQEEIAPSFQHVGAADIGQVQDGNALVRVLVGDAFGLTSPVNTLSPTLYLHVELPAHSAWVLPTLAPEMALYSPEQPLEIEGQAVAPCEMVVLQQGSTYQIKASATGAQFVVVGGAPLAQHVHMWWNYVSVDRKRIEAAALRWEQGGFDPIPGESQRVAGPKFVSSHPAA